MLTSRIYSRVLFALLLLTTTFACGASSPVEALAQQAAAHPNQSGAYVLEKGEESLLARAWLTETATQSIDIQYFIWSTDNVGTLATEALLRAADRGVKVRVVVDDLLIDAEPETLLSIAAHPNVEIRIYNPQHSVGVSLWQRIKNLFSDFRGFNQRMHDKSVIYDHTAAITGGRNMADEYYDYSHEYNFRDRDVLVAGPVVEKMEASFERFWRHPLTVPIETLLADELTELTVAQQSAYRDWLHAYAQDRKNFSPAVRQALEETGENFSALIAQLAWTDIRFISDMPGKNGETDNLSGGGASTSALIELITQAKQNVTIQSPYLVMPEGGLALFRDLIQRGVEVSIVTNSLASTDNLQAFSGYYNQRQELLEAGIKIYEFKPDAQISRELSDRSVPFGVEHTPIFSLHAKSLVVDGEVTFIGTFNLDPRSANLNTEIGIFIHNEQVAKQIESAIQQDMAPENSWQVGLENPEEDVGVLKYLKLQFWRLFPLEPIL
ncbi:MAG: phospholipase D family protein [Chromatiales bacterium]|nr:phospholipase D family protein [Chromatiales bacterium]